MAVDTDSTVELRDLASLRADFLAARTFVDTYLASEIEDDGSGPTGLDALWIAAIIMYGRAFSSGVRHAGRPSTDHLGVESLDRHTYFIDVRNKYLAHSVNAFEKVTVFVDLNDPAGPAGISKVGELHSGLMRLSRTAAATLGRLCEEQIELLTRRIDVLHAKVAKEVIAMGVEKAYALPDFSPPILDGSKPRSRR